MHEIFVKKMRNRKLRPNHASDQKVEEIRPPFFAKKWGSVFFQFLIQGMVWSQKVIFDYFMHAFFKIVAP